MTSRPLMSAVAAQQAVLDQIRADQAKILQDQAVQREQITMIARLAGISPEIAKLADVANPAQPIPDPGEQAATETTEQAVTPLTHDDVRSPGQTGGSTEHVPAASTDVVIQPGESLPTQPFNQLIDVTTPTSGTNTGEVHPDQMRIETDVRHMNPMQPEVAFPWNISPNQSNSNPPHDGEMAKSSSRFPASLRLARLRIDAGLDRGDDITIAAKIEASTMPDSVIEHEIAVLSAVAQAATPQAATADTMPRRAANKVRTAPSLASAPSMDTSGSSASDDTFLWL